MRVLSVVDRYVDGVVLAALLIAAVLWVGFSIEEDIRSQASAECGGAEP